MEAQVAIEHFDAENFEPMSDGPAISQDTEELAQGLSLLEADKYMRGYAYYSAELLKIQAAGAMRIQEITDWMHMHTERLEHRREFFAEVVKSHLKIQPDKTRSISLPSGDVKRRKVPESLKAGQEEEAKETLKKWALANKLEHIAVTPDMKRIRAHFKETGEIPPGTEVQDAYDSYSIKTGEVRSGRYAEGPVPLPGLSDNT